MRNTRKLNKTCSVERHGLTLSINSLNNDAAIKPNGRNEGVISTGGAEPTYNSAATATSSRDEEPEKLLAVSV